jgi:hypothetical protein
VDEKKNPVFSKPTAPSKIRHPPKNLAFSKLIGAALQKLEAFQNFNREKNSPRRRRPPSPEFQSPKFRFESQNPPCTLHTDLIYKMAREQQKRSSLLRENKRETIFLDRSCRNTKREKWRRGSVA